MKISCLALFLACFSFAPLGASPRFEVVRDSAGFVPRWSCGQFVVTPPAEGLWSIATAWRDGAPAEWRHVRAVTCERTGEWTILSGELACRGGRWLLRDAYRVEDDLLHCIRRYEWTEGPALDSVTLGIRWQLPPCPVRPFLPGILYYGNPSGARNTPDNVVRYEGRAGEFALFEEHRYQMPFAAFEI